MSEIVIREAQSKDAGELCRIYAYYVEKTAVTFEYTVPSVEEFTRRILKTKEKYPYLTAMVDGKIAGYAYAGVFHDREAYDRSVELSIYVDKDYHKQGIGRKLYEALEEELRQMGILNLYACIASPIRTDATLDHNSEYFHAHMGFKTVGTFHRCGFKFDRWYNMIWMEKQIGEYTDDPEPVRWKNGRP